MISTYSHQDNYEVEFKELWQISLIWGANTEGQVLSQKS